MGLFGATGMAFLVLLACLLVLLARKRRPVPKIVLLEIPRVIFGLPTSWMHGCVQIMAILVTLNFLYNVSRPFFDEEMREEYEALPGGLATAWLVLFIFGYLPYLIFYIWCAFYFDRAARSQRQDGP